MDCVCYRFTSIMTFTMHTPLRRKEKYIIFIAAHRPSLLFALLKTVFYYERESLLKPLCKRNEVRSFLFSGLEIVWNDLRPIRKTMLTVHVLYKVCH
jgi:hypothetical protein